MSPDGTSSWGSTSKNEARFPISVSLPLNPALETTKFTQQEPWAQADLHNGKLSPVRRQIKGGVKGSQHSPDLEKQLQGHLHHGLDAPLPQPPLLTAQVVPQAPHPAQSSGNGLALPMWTGCLETCYRMEPTGPTGADSQDDLWGKQHWKPKCTTEARSGHFAVIPSPRESLIL